MLSSPNAAPVLEDGANLSTLVGVGVVALAEAAVAVSYEAPAADVLPLPVRVQPAEQPSVTARPRRITQVTAMEGNHLSWRGFVRDENGIAQPKLGRAARIRERQARREAEARAAVEAAATAQVG